MTEGTISFKLDQREVQKATLDYRPWGSRTIKLKVSTAVDTPASLHLKPAQWSFINKTAYGYASGSSGTSFILNWGGGHDGGPPVNVRDKFKVFEEAAPLPADQENVIYFNIRHIGPDLPAEIPLMIGAYEGEATEPWATLVINLRRPASYSDDVIEIEREEARWQTTAGDKLPLYDCRWWPKQELQYNAYQGDSVEELLIEKTAVGQLTVTWDGQPVAIIRDQTKPSVMEADNNRLPFELLDFELFQLPVVDYDADYEETFLVLRLWFFWLDLEFESSFWGLWRHEVPDAERFDILFKRPVGAGDERPFIMLACTDSHWREMWGHISHPPLQGSLGLSPSVLAHIGVSKEEDERPITNPIGYIERLAQTIDTRPDLFRKRAKGLEAHVPALNGVTQIKIIQPDDEIEAPDISADDIVITENTITFHDMTSTDVRRVA